MHVLEPLTPEAWRGYQRPTFPAGSWVCEEGMLRTVAEAEPIDLITRQQVSALRTHPRVARRPRRQEWHPLSCHRSAAARVAAWPGHAATR
jgi:hypothetical protein